MESNCAGSRQEAAADWRRKRHCSSQRPARWRHLTCAVHTTQCPRSYKPQFGQHGGRTVKKFGIYATTAVGATAVSMAFFRNRYRRRRRLRAARRTAMHRRPSAMRARRPSSRSRAGDTLSDDDCIVTHSQSAPWIKGDSFAPVTDTVLVYLNCNADRGERPRIPGTRRAARRAGPPFARSAAEGTRQRPAALAA